MIRNEEKVLTVPLTRPELVIRMAGNYIVENKTGGCTNEKSWLQGQSRSATTTRISGLHECMGVVFTTTGLTAFTKMGLAELTDQIVGLENIFPGSDELHSIINEQASITKKIQTLENFLLVKISETRNLSLVYSLLEQIHHHDLKLSVQSICRERNLSRKTLNVHFQTHVGISLSDYIRQYRMNKVLRNLCDQPGQRLIETAYEYYFFDQPHFINQFAQYTGMTPGQYVQKVENKLVDRRFPNFISC